MMAGTLSVSLNDTRVGTITNIPGDYNLFAFDPAFVEDANRPILSQSFIDSGEQLIRVVPRTQTITPSFFSNLLPEPDSVLRSIVARQRGIKKARDFPFLAALGSDLPGAVVISGTETDIDSTDPDERAEDDVAPLRFSLAGMQLKFSASMVNGRFYITERRDGASWIVKMPTNAYPRLPENEFAMMRLATAIGLDVPETELRDVDSVNDLPRGIPGLRPEERSVFAIRRFDRDVGGRRVHVEDFNQIVAQKPGPEKYENKSTANIGKVIGELCDLADVKEFVRRVVFGVLIGNDDMHLKNWALMYPDGRHAKIAPLYDFVCTRRDFPEGELALTIGGERRFQKITRDTMQRFAKQAEFPKTIVLQLVDEVCDRLKDEWPKFKSSIADETLVSTLEKHFQSVPLWLGK